MAGKQQPEKKRKRKRSGNSADMPLFVGYFERTVTEDRRLSTPLKIKKQLEEHKVDKFWVALHPTKAVVFLCPPEFWNACKRELEGWLRGHGVAESEAQEIWVLDEVELDSKGRITLHELAMEHLKIQGDPRDVVIRARGHWFEIQRKVEIQQSQVEGEGATPPKKSQPRPLSAE